MLWKKRDVFFKILIIVLMAFKIETESSFNKPNAFPMNNKNPFQKSKINLTSKINDTMKTHNETLKNNKNNLGIDYID